MRGTRVWVAECAMALVVCGAAWAGIEVRPATPAVPDEATVTVIGKSAAKGDAARDEALRDALRNAVEQAAGSFISSQTKTENYQLAYDVILSRSKGYVKSYDVVSEKRDEQGVFAIEIKALVKTKACADDWLEFRSILLQKGMPRFMLSVSETVDDKPNKINTAQTALEKVLLTFGLPMVDKKQVSDNDQRDLDAARVADDLSRVAAISARYKADIAIVGKSRASLTEEKEIYGIRTFLYGSDVSLRGVKTQNARLLFSDSAQSAFGDRNQAEAARKVLDQAGDLLAKKFIVGIVDAWTKELSRQVGTDYDLEVSGIKFADRTALLKELLANTKLITHANSKDYRNEVSFIVVGCTASTEKLAEFLSELKSVKLEVTEVTPTSIKAKVAAEK